MVSSVSWQALKSYLLIPRPKKKNILMTEDRRGSHRKSKQYQSHRMSTKGTILKGNPLPEVLDISSISSEGP